MLFTPSQEFPPRKIIRPPIVGTGGAANPVSSYVLTYGEIRYLCGDTGIPIKEVLLKINTMLISPDRAPILLFAPYAHLG